MIVINCLIVFFRFEILILLNRYDSNLLFCMRTFLIILLSIIGISCKTNYYLSDPIKSIPNIGLQTNLKSNGILIASDANLRADTVYFEKCLQSLRMFLETRSEIKIKDEILFHKSPNIVVLIELKTKYNVDGLLLLTDLNVFKSCFEVPSGKFVYTDNRMPEPYLQITKTNITWTNVDVKITSHWEYYDFVTGNSYRFSIKNDNILELGEHVPDLYAFIKKNVELLDPAFYQNGTITAANLIGLTK